MLFSFVTGVLFMKTNIKIRTPVFTAEGAPSTKVSPIQQLKRMTMACMLWEDTFYVDGKKHTEILEDLCKKVSTLQIVSLALDCHQKGLLRHIPLFLLVQAMKNNDGKCHNTKDVIYHVCNRPDQMTELLSLWWKDGKVKLPNQLKKGLARAFTRFDEYQLAKYNRDTPIKLRDVLFMVHPKPFNQLQADVWKRLVDNKLQTPETWETKLSAGEDKKDSFQDLLEKGKMGKLAIIRNMRNMEESGVSKELVEKNLMRNDRPILPFQFLAASKACPKWEDVIDKAMLKACEGKEKIKGNTLLLIDVSGSMDYALSSKGLTQRNEASCGIAILLREICENVEVWTFSERLVLVPPRHGMPLKDAINQSQPHSSTYLGQALKSLNASKNPNIPIDRIIVITDEQAHDVPPRMDIPNCYIINVGVDQNGIKNNGQWLTINGFSEHVIDYIMEIEKENSGENQNIDISLD